MTDFRQAEPADIEAIYAVLVAIAPEIPVKIDDSNGATLKGMITQCCARKGGMGAVVSVDENAEVVGFVLYANKAKLPVNGFQCDAPHVELKYGGIAPSHRTGHRFKRLLENLQAAGKPPLGVVNHRNKFMASYLIKNGFQQAANVTKGPEEDVYVWNFPDALKDD